MVRNRVLPCALRTWRSLGHLLEGPAFVTLPTWHPGRTAGLVPEQSHLSTNQTDDAWLGWELRLSANLEGLFLVLLSVEGRGGPTRPFFSQTRVSALGGCGREGRLPRHRGCSPRGGGGDRRPDPRTSPGLPRDPSGFYNEEMGASGQRQLFPSRWRRVCRRHARHEAAGVPRALAPQAVAGGEGDLPSGRPGPWGPRRAPRRPHAACPPCRVTRTSR